MTEKKYSFNWPLVANTQITQYLEKSIAKNQIAGTYIFHGPDNLGKTTIASHFAKILLCQNILKGSGQLPCLECASCKRLRAEKNGDVIQEEISGIHGDFHIIKKQKEKKNISIEQAREFIRMLSLSSFNSKYKIGIIKHAESLSEKAANALLKTLEEPKDNVVIILVTDNLSALPATIASRSQVLGFRTVPRDVIYTYLVEKYQVPRSKAKIISSLALGRPALALKFFEDTDFYEQYLEKVKIFIRFFWQDVNTRIANIADLLGPKPSGQKAVKIALRILQVWQGILRDLLLLNHDINKVQHHIYLEELGMLKKRVTLRQILSLLEYLKISEGNIRANVNPKAVLEAIVLTI